MNWEKLKIFYHVATAGSFTSAGHQLNISQSSLSRQIGDLEHRLKTKLFKRYSGGVTLTQEGQFLYHHAQKVYDAMLMAEKFLLSDETEQQCELKILITPLLGARWLFTHLKSFLETFSQIRLSIVDSSKMDNLHEYDIIIAESLDERQDMIQKKLTTLNFSYLASKQYLETFGTPTQFSDLENHRLIHLDRSAFQSTKHFEPMNFQGTGEKTFSPFLKVNSVQALVNAALCDLGIIEIYDQFPGIEKDNLVSVLNTVPKPTVDVYCIYPTEYAQSTRIKAFRDALINGLNAPVPLQ